MTEEAQDVEQIEDESRNEVEDGVDESDNSSVRDAESQSDEFVPPQRTSKRGGKFLPLPTPPKFRMKLEEFAKYWWSLKKHDRISRVRVYAYRHHPVVDVVQSLPEAERARIRKLHAQGKKTGVNKYLDPSKTEEPFDPDDPMQVLLHRFGCGWYDFILKDTHPNYKKAICQTVLIKTPVMYDEYPPDVDPAQVKLNEADNAAYIQWARNHGIAFPGDPNWKSKIREEDDEEGDGEMATVTKLMLNNTLQENRDMKQRLFGGKKNADGDDSLITALISQQTAMMTLMQDSANKHAEMLGKRLEAAETRANAAPPAPPNPVEQMKSLAETLRALIPPPPPPPPDPLTQLSALAAIIATLRGNPPDTSKPDPMMTFLQQQMQRDSDRAKEERERLDKTAQVERERAAKLEERTHQLIMQKNSPTGGIEEAAKTFDLIANVAERFNGGGGTSWPEFAAEVAPKVLETIQGVSNAYTAGATAQAAMASRPASPPVVVNTGVPGVPAPQQNPMQPQTEEQQMKAMYASAAAFIHKPLIIALQNNTPGYEFAARLLQQYGQQFEWIYTQLLPKGRNGVLGDGGLLRVNAELFGELLNVGANGKLENFVDEFLNVQKVRAILGAASSQAQPQQPQPMPRAEDQATPQPVTPSNVTPMPPQNPSSQGPGSGGGPRQRPPAA